MATAATEGLSVEAVSKSYGELVALDGMTFSVSPGELFGFCGSNGAGKTTTMRIILGVLAADAGVITLGGQPVDLHRRRRIGYMPAERGLYPKMKVGPQLTYLARLHGKSTADARDAVARWTTRLGIESRLDSTVDALSTGNQQRVQLAAALVHDPDLLVLDEPFSGLDPVAVDVMSEVLVEKAAAGVPVVFSSHQLELVEQLCDRIGIVVGGRLRTEGTVDELRADGGVQYVVHAPQARPGWAATVPCVSVLSEEGGRAVVSLDQGADEQKLLATALSTGPVLEFARRHVPLAELFREVVSA